MINIRIHKDDPEMLEIYTVKTVHAGNKHRREFIIWGTVHKDLLTHNTAEFRQRSVDYDDLINFDHEVKIL